MTERAPWTPDERWQPNTWALLIISAFLLGGLLGVAVLSFFGRGQFAEYRYSLWRWEAETLAGTLFRVAGVTHEADPEDAEEAIRQYFALTSRIRAELEAPDPDPALLDTLLRERSLYENTVEAAIAARVAAAARAAGLSEPLPLFDEVRILWPPVAFELTQPPQLLVISPRDRIERERVVLLRNDLSLREIERIEEEADDGEHVSLVVSIGGLAAYPAILREDRSYWSVVETVAHEWVHHYLAFYPLGQQWLAGSEGETLNETVANVAGRELAALVHRLFPVDFPDGLDGRGPERPPPDIDFRSEMRALRLEVDRLLAAGRIEEAERLMEEKRRHFATHGIYIRKLNQAYFAFYGTYADEPASSSPIGPKVERVWELTGHVGEFLRRMRDIRTEEDLDRLIESLERAAE